MKNNKNSLWRQQLRNPSNVLGRIRHFSATADAFGAITKPVQLTCTFAHRFSAFNRAYFRENTPPILPARASSIAIVFSGDRGKVFRKNGNKSGDAVPVLINAVDWCLGLLRQVLWKGRAKKVNVTYATGAWRDRCGGFWRDVQVFVAFGDWEISCVHFCRRSNEKRC